MNLLSFITMAPPLFLVFMIYQADRIEREPAGLLIRLFVLGMLSCIPAAIIEGVLCGVLVIAVTLAGSIPAIRMLLKLRPAEVLHGR